ncbi:MAG TPA: hypothetical protein PK771_09025, partial [Spirochaetota bacterium]|nr:hypothetical protein [Spirochaetota bacterium]
FLMPVLPYITDTPEMIKKTLSDCKEVAIDYVIFGGLTLKPGIQREYYLNSIKNYFPHLVSTYENLYKDSSIYGEQDYKYSNMVNNIFNKIATELKIPKRIPAYIFKNIVNKNDLVIIILEQLSYLLNLSGKKNNYSYAAYNLSKLTTDISFLSDEELLKIGGVGDFTLKIIREIIQTGESPYYNSLLI